MSYKITHGYWWQRRWLLAKFASCWKPVLLGCLVFLTALLLTMGIHLLATAGWSQPDDSSWSQTWQCDPSQHMTSRIINSDEVVLTCLG